MGIYDSGFGPKFDLLFNRKKFLPIIGGLIVLIILIGIIYFGVISIDSSPIGFNFEKNPIKTGESTNIIVSITNNSDVDATNVSLALRIKETSEFDIIALNEKFKGSISLLSSNSSREVIYLINPIGNVLPGSYTLVAETVINGAKFEKEAKLNVEN